MTKDEALKMCLEYIETDAHERKYVRHAIKEALAQPEQEPVAWAHHSTFENLNSFERSRYSATLSKKQTDACCIPLYTTPPQRTWVGLTDEDDIDWEDGGNLKDLVKAIEAKLKEKNG